MKESFSNMIVNQSTRPLLPIVVTLTATLALLLAAPAAARAPGGFSATELKSILPLLRKHGLVGLSESHDNGEPKSMTLAIRVKASREQVFSVFEKPENFYYISTLFKENNVLQRHDNNQAWSWASRHKLFSFTGTNTIALYSPRRADVKIAKSTVGNGEFTFTMHEDGPAHTILVLSGFLDVQTSEWLIRYLLGGNPSMMQAMNVAIGMVVIKGAKTMAERVAAGKPLEKHRTRGKAGGDLRPLGGEELVALAPLLVRGQVIISDSHPRGRLDQVTVVDTLAAPGRKVLDAVSAPSNYEKMIKAITNVQVHEATDDRIDFSWTLGFSVFGITSRNRMTPTDSGVLVEGIEGDLEGARWLWQIVPVEDNKTVVAYHGFAHVGKTAGIMHKTINREPYLEHGVMAGSNMVMVRAIRGALEGR
jgi:ribosome-associated toxin RatA of RatAB toxin-antitoxin module